MILSLQRAKLFYLIGSDFMVHMYNVVLKVDCNIEQIVEFLKDTGYSWDSFYDEFSFLSNQYIQSEDKALTAKSAISNLLVNIDEVLANKPFRYRLAYTDRDISVILMSENEEYSVFYIYALEYTEEY